MRCILKEKELQEVEKVITKLDETLAGYTKAGNFFYKEAVTETAYKREVLNVMGILKQINDPYRKVTGEDIAHIVREDGVIKIYVEPSEKLMTKLIDNEGTRAYSPKVRTKYDIHQMENLTTISKFKALRENEAVRLTEKLSKVRYDKSMAKSNKEEYKKLIKEEESIKEAIEKNSIILASLNDSTPFDHLKRLFYDDLEKVRGFLNKKNLEDAKAAEELLNFYTNLFTRDISPLFSNEELDSPNFAELRDGLKDLMYSAQLLAGKMKGVKESIVLEIINSDERVKKLHGEEGLTKDELFHKKEGLQDINLITSFIQSPAYQIGITDNNGTLAKMAEILLQESYHKHMLPHNYFMEKLDALEPLIEKKLGIKRFGHKVYVDYSIFMDRKTEALSRTNIIGKYKGEVFQQRYQDYKKFSKLVYEILSEKDTSHTAKQKEIFELRNTLLAGIANNFEVLDVTLSPEIIEYLKTVDEIFIPDKYNIRRNNTTPEEYKSKLVSELGEEAYLDLVEQQKDIFNTYIVQAEAKQEDVDISVALGEITQEEADKIMEQFNLARHPILNNFKYHNKYTDNSVSISSKKATRFHFMNPKGDMNLAMVPLKTDANGNSTGFYDERFEQIENDPILLEYYKLLKEFTTYMRDGLTPTDRNSMGYMSMPAVEKTYKDILADPDLHMWGVITELWKNFIEWVKNLPIEKVQNFFSSALLDPTTHKLEDKINAGDLKFLKSEITSKSREAIIILQRMMGTNSGTYTFSEKLVVQDHKELVLFIAQKLGITPSFIGDRLDINSTLTDISSILPDLIIDEEININKLVEDLVTNEVMKKYTSNLTKIMRASSYSMVAYRARQDALPLQRVIKELYTNIKSHKKTKQGKTIVAARDNGEEDREEIKIVGGLRDNANAQYESWYNRAVLNQKNNSNNSDSFIKKKALKLVGGKIGNKISEYKGKINDKMVTQASKTDNTNLGHLNDARSALSSKLEGELSNEARDTLEKNVRVIDNILQSKQKKISFNAIIDNMLYSLTRFVGLGYNGNSAITNFVDGQLGNLLAAASGKYFKEQHYWEALDILKASMWKGFTLGASKYTPVYRQRMKAAALSKVLMKRFELLEDPYNEFEKADNQASGKILPFLNPQEATSRVEYQNQAVIMIAMLKGMEIKGKDESGKEVTTSLWDAMMQGIHEGENVGTLGKDYRTPQNRVNYENVSIEAFSELQKEDSSIKVDKKFQTAIADTIVQVHGDYHELKGGRIQDTLGGRGLIMFKKWIGSYLYTRFGATQDNIALGITDKGRYRSFTPVSGGMVTGVLAYFTIGPIGAMIAGSIGSAIGSFAGADPKLNTQFSIIKELIVLNTQLLKRVIGLPINYIAGRQVINPNKAYFSPLKKIYNEFEETYEEVDLQNIRGNMAEIGSMVSFTIMYILAKMAFWDDDDEEDSARRMTHNYIVNKLNQFMEQIAAFTNPALLWESNQDWAAFRTLRNMSKEIELIQGYYNGEDMIKTGYYAGRSRFRKNTAKIIFPSIVRDWYGGFESMSSRQFNKSPFDKWAWGPKKIMKEEIKGWRRHLKEVLKSKGVNKNVLDSVIRKTYKHRKSSKKPAETLEENYDRIHKLINNESAIDKLINEVNASKKKKKK